MNYLRKIRRNILSSAAVLAAFFIVSPISLAHPAEMDDYCITPPFVVGGGVQPNLLLMIDNSASMYDLSYEDRGKLNLTTDPPSFDREPTYCYDQSYKEANTYIGYFKNGTCSVTTSEECLTSDDCPGSESCNDVYYTYDLSSDERFEVYDLGFPLSCDYFIPSTLCVDIDDNDIVTRFIAKGDYLNWLTASKFDIEKKVLTGGKYNTTAGELIAETRGCVGRRFVKEPNAVNPLTGTADFIEYDDGDINPNIGLGITFAVRGPINITTPAAPHVGGQTYLEIYKGDYREYDCNKAIHCFTPGNCTNPETRDAVALCIEGGGISFCEHNLSVSCISKSDCYPYQTSPAKAYQNTCRDPSLGDTGTVCVTDQDCDSGQYCASNSGSKDPCIYGSDPATTAKNIFAHSVAECWQHLKDPFTFQSWNDTLETVTNRCNDLYKNFEDGTCSQTSSTSCHQDSDCPEDEHCINGPYLIAPGNPAFICNILYGGGCYAGGYPEWDNTTSGLDPDWPDKDCVINASIKFCEQTKFPPVVDPTDDPSSTQLQGNLPAIIADLGVQGQLGKVIRAMTVRINESTVPEGLIQEYDGLIRMGSMSFNFAGSASECDSTLIDKENPLKCPLICENRRCSVTSDTICTSNSQCPAGEKCSATPCNLLPDGSNNDCPGAEACVVASSGTVNIDGASLLHYIGYPGECSVTTTTSCTEDADCPLTETCITGGDHTKGLVKSIDDIRADSWTPFSEAFYEAIGYYARMTTHPSPPLTLSETICPPGEGTGVSREDLCLNGPLNCTDYCTNSNPSQYQCQSNNVLLISDGLPTGEQNTEVLSAINAVRSDNLTPQFPDDGQYDLSYGSNTCNDYWGTRNFDDITWIAKNRNITDLTFSSPVGRVYESVTTHVLFNGTESDDPGQCNPVELLSEAARKGGGLYRQAEKPEELGNQLRALLEYLASTASSGTAASVLASGSGEGANLLQAIFYPNRKKPTGSGFDDAYSDLYWIGTLQNLWYYVDPRFSASSIREDTDVNYIQHLENDFVVNFYFDQATTQTMVQRYQYDNFDDSLTLQVPDIKLEDISNLWEAGKILWNRDISVAGLPRRILTTTDGASLMDFDTDVIHMAALMPHLQSADAAEAEAIIRYTHGEDTKCSVSTSVACSYDADCPLDGETCGFSNGVDAPLVAGNYRVRSVAIDLNSDGDVVDAGEEPKEWKLGDIINATPKVLSWVPINNYVRRYGDQTYRRFTCSDPFSSCTSGYKDRGLVFTAANDGMLHAFKLGRLELEWEGRDINLEFSRLVNPDATTPLGHEEWAFIPQHALPYLKYVGDPSYCHLYINDGSPLIGDVSIGGLPDDKRPADGSSWRTVLIGNMKYGGACRNKDVACNLGNECVNTPITDEGFSSYYALDITNPQNPSLLWEFTDPQLGLSTAGASIVRTNSVIDGNEVQDTNGHWFVVLPSGSTGPIDLETKQFLGRSDQNLRLFVLDLETGVKKAVIESFNGSSIPNAFAGSSIQSAIDYDSDYDDDILYVPYIKSSRQPAMAGTDTWNDGGIVRISTKGSNNPTTWVASKLADGIGPVSSSVDELKNRVTGKLWLFFGTGRYFFKKGAKLDDPSSGRRIFGVQDPCFNFDIDPSCVETINVDADLQNVTDAATEPDTTKKGWYINLQSQEGSFDAERVTTDPVGTVSQVVYFTTFSPSSDVCSYGGASHLWGVRYDTGGCADELLTGKALLQVSTGSIEQIDLEDDLKCDRPEGEEPPPSGEERLKRRSLAFSGKPPEGPGLILISAPPPVETFIHIREK